MQKHKHASTSKTKENPSPAAGLQGADSADPGVRGWETTGTGGGRLEEPGWQR